MLAKFFKSSQPGVFIIIAFLALLTRVPLLFNVVPIQTPVGFSPAYELVYKALENFQIVGIVLSYLLLMIQAIFFNNIVGEYNISNKNSYLPALFYVLLFSSSKGLMQLNPILLANFFIIFSIRSILAVYTSHEKITPIFNAGFLIAIASMFYLPAIALLLYLILTLIVFRELSLRFSFVVFAGAMVPYLYVSTYYYWTNQLLIKFHEALQLFSKCSIYFRFEISTIFYLVFFGIAFLVGLFQYWYRLTEKLVKIRKYFFSCLCFIIIVLASLFFSNERYSMHFGLFSLPAAIFIANYVFLCRKLWIANLIIIGFIIHVIALYI